MESMMESMMMAEPWRIFVGRGCQYGSSALQIPINRPQRDT
ncbi:MAG: hypothetical protein RR410_02480 [Alistipes sp.]